MNALTGKPYRGVNIVTLWADAMLRGFDSEYWATYRRNRHESMVFRPQPRCASITAAAESIRPIALGWANADR